MVKKTRSEPTRPSVSFECKGCFGHVTVLLGVGYTPEISWDGCICHDADIETHNARLIGQAVRDPNAPNGPLFAPPLGEADDPGIPHAHDMIDEDDEPGDDDEEV